MNYNKVIKDLKERNNTLAHQYRLRDMRCVNLEQENAELKKQLEENKLNHKQLKDLEKIQKSFIEIKKQQQEFIKYLKDMLDDEYDIFSVVRVKDVLSKYKEIIGETNDTK